jgi:hypothetical protein
MGRAPPPEPHAEADAPRFGGGTAAAAASRRAGAGAVPSGPAGHTPAAASGATRIGDGVGRASPPGATAGRGDHFRHSSSRVLDRRGSGPVRQLVAPRAGGRGWLLGRPAVLGPGVRLGRAPTALSIRVPAAPPPPDYCEGGGGQPALPPIARIGRLPAGGPLASGSLGRGTLGRRVASGATRGRAQGCAASQGGVKGMRSRWRGRRRSWQTPSTGADEALRDTQVQR